MGKVLQAITGSTKRIVGIMAHDFQRVFTNPVAAIIAVGVTRYVLPVPAGPTPMVMVFFKTDSIYFFCPMVLGLMGRPLELMQMTSCVSSLMRSSCPARTSEIT